MAYKKTRLTCHKIILKAKQTLLHKETAKLQNVLIVMNDGPLDS